MSGITLEVMADRKRPEGGHAVILLRGLKDQPRNAEYVIEPLDAAIDVGADTGWPRGPKRPIETRMTEDGLELVAGPDVVENPNLLPGTPVLVVVPSLGAKAELLWPDVAPLARPRKAAVIAVAPPAPAKPAVTPPANPAAAVARTSGSRPAITLNAAGGEGLVRAEVAANTAARAAAAAAAVARSSTGRAHGPRPEPTAGESASGDRLSRLSQRHGEPAGGRPPGLRRIRVARPSISEAPAPARANGSSAVARAPEPLKPTSSLQVYPSAAGPQAQVTDRGSRRLALAAIVTAMVAALSTVYSNLVRPDGAVRASPPIVQPAPVAVLPVGQPSIALYEIFATGITSPRGVSAKDVTFAQALERADQMLHGPAGTRDAAEGQYWLQRALVTLINDDRARWALSQLGTLYADPANGTADYSRARALWQVAGGLGDPVAMCFLGNLHEFGLGVAVDKAAALGWYMRAKAAGGCRENDVAIDRVKK